MPKVSICVPTYQNQEELQRLLDSAREQTFQDFEFIITDDSKDKKIEEYISILQDRKDIVASKIRYFHNKKPLGHIYNWNEALSYANGEFVKIMFSDDWFTYPDSLEKMVAALENAPEAGLVFCGSMQVSKKDSYSRKPEAGYVEELQKDYRYLFISNQIGAPSDTMYRRELQVKFDEKSNWASDVFLYMEILKKNPKFIYLKEPLISIGIHDNQYTESFSENDSRIFKDYQYMFEKYNLQDSKECRDYFLYKYLIRYPDGKKEALQSGYGKTEFTKALTDYYRKEVLPCWGKALLRKVRGK